MNIPLPARQSVTPIAAASGWGRIHERDCPLHLEARDPPICDETCNLLLADVTFGLRFEGSLADLSSGLAALPRDLADDIAALANRFAVVMGVDAVRVRVERIDTNACKKVHADYTDVRLITTYAGPGTDVAPHGEGDVRLERVPTGWIGLFKGRTYAADHPPCFHRSPPVEGSGERRLVLVVDTPAQSVAGQSGMLASKPPPPPESCTVG